MYIYIVPALHKKPDLKISDINKKELEFALIEHNKEYTGKWNVNDLNDEPGEPSEIKFSIVNWIYQIHPLRRRWILRPRQEWFKLLHINTTTGTFSFKHKTRSRGNNHFAFGISIILLIKETENLTIFYTSSLLSFIPKMSTLGSGAISEFCTKWKNYTKETFDSINLLRCPCTMEAAKMDPNLNVDFTCSITHLRCHENVKAHRCYLVKTNKMYVHKYYYCIQWVFE